MPSSSGFSLVSLARNSVSILGRVKDAANLMFTIHRDKLHMNLV